MKTLLLTLAILASPMLASAQGPIPQTTVEAVHILEQKTNAFRFMTGVMVQFHADAMRLGQEFFDVLGTSAEGEILAYQAVRNAWLVIDPTCGIPAVDPTVFAIQPDGTVIFTAPTEE